MYSSLAVMVGGADAQRCSGLLVVLGNGLQLRGVCKCIR